MPYQTVSELPQEVQERYNPHQLNAFLTAFNAAMDSSGKPDESQAFAIAHQAAQTAGQKAFTFDTPYGFKALPNRQFLAWYTNPYKDKDGEWFAEKAIDADLERMTQSGDYPELWFFHIPGSKFGQVSHVFKAGRFAVAFGQADDSPLGTALYDYAVANGYTLSHGFTYEPDHFNDNTYEAFKTFEISVLPSDTAANPYTTFISIANNEDQGMKTLTPKQVDELRKALKGAGVSLETLLQAGEKTSAVLDQNASYKAVSPEDAIAELTEDALEAVANPEMESEIEVDEEEMDMKGYMRKMDSRLKALEDMAKAILDKMSAGPATMPQEEKASRIVSPSQAAAPLPPQSAPATAEKTNNPAPVLPQEETTAQRLERLENAFKQRYGSMQGNIVTEVIQGFAQDGQKQGRIGATPNAFDANWFTQQAVGGQ